MKATISVLADVHLLPEAQDEIKKLSDRPVVFPDDEAQPDLAELIARTNGAGAVLVSPGTQLTAEYFEACPSVKYVGLCGTSMANIDLGAAKSRGIRVSNVVDYGDEPTAEFIFMQVVALARGTGKYQWRDDPCELMGKSVGIVGLGALGQAIARLALAYKMKVNYYSLHRKSGWEEKGLNYSELPELIPQSEIIILSAPTNVEIFGKDEFALTKPNTLLVQASSGSVINREAFLDWIARDNNFALFDYSAGEDNYQAYKGLPRVTFPKIVAGHTIETRQRLGQKVIENLQNYEA